MGFIVTIPEGFMKTDRRRGVCVHTHVACAYLWYTHMVHGHKYVHTCGVCCVLCCFGWSVDVKIGV